MVQVTEPKDLSGNKGCKAVTSSVRDFFIDNIEPCFNPESPFQYNYHKISNHQNVYPMINRQILLLASFCLLFSGSEYNLNGQSMTLEEVYANFMANPPIFGDSATRKACFDVLDIVCLAENASTDQEIKTFYNNMLQNVTSDIRMPSSGLAVVYAMYNHGFIIKMQDLVIAFDLINGMSQWNIIPDRVLNEIDVALVTHEHTDHYDPAVLYKIKHNGGSIIIPSEMSFTGAIGLSPDDSVMIGGFIFKAYYALHGDMPCRIYEVYSPNGIKIVHTGDNQTSVTLPDIKDIDILLLNSWVNEGDGAFSNVIGMYNCLQKLTPQLMIPGHFNELSHVPSQRFAYDSVYALMEMDPPSDVLVLAWGERTIYRPNSVLPVYNTTCAPIIDGYWDTTWAFTPVISMPRTILDPPYDWFDLYGKFRTMWNSDNLYLFLTVQDDILRTDNEYMWNNDVIELFLDGNNSKNDAGIGYDEDDIQMRFEYMGGSWQADNSEYVFQETARGYTMEMRIPVTDLRFTPEPGHIIGFDAQVTDNDDGTQNSIIRWWSESLDNWFNPSLFGTAKLISSNLSGNKDIFYTPAGIRIDANLDDVWIGKELMIANNLMFGEKYIYTPDDVNFLWNTLWDDSYLYFWFEVTDDTLINDSGEEFYQDDCIEIWIDGDNSKGDMHDGVNDYCFQFRYHPITVIETVKQPIGPAVVISDILQAAKLTDKGFILEVAIPLQMLDIEPFDSTFIGIDFDYDDDDNEGERETKYKAYAQFDNAWEDPQQWGTGMLTGSGNTPIIPSIVSQTDRLSESVYVFPNPFRNHINIRIQLQKETDISIEIFEISGKLIHSEKIIAKPFDEVNIGCDLQKIDKGIYYINVKTESIIYSEKILKF